MGFICHFCCLKGSVNSIRLFHAEANFSLLMTWVCPLSSTPSPAEGLGPGPAVAGLLVIDKSQLILYFFGTGCLGRPLFLPENALGHFVDLGEF